MTIQDVIEIIEREIENATGDELKRLERKLIAAKEQQKKSR